MPDLPEEEPAPAGGGAGVLDLHHVEHPGGAPALVLVHGLASNLRLWDGVARRVAAAGRRVVAVDLRGHGLSPKPDGPGAYELPVVAADVGHLLDRLGVDRAVLAGQSYGGNLVLELAARLGPSRAVAVACVDGGFLALRRQFGSWEDCARALAPPRMAGTPLEQVERWLRGRHPDWSDEAVAGALACYEVRADGTVAPHLTFERHMAVLRGMWEHDVEACWQAVEAPVTVVAAGDPSRAGAKAAGVDAMARALRSGRVVWLDGDHDLHAQRPDDVTEVLLCASS